MSGTYTVSTINGEAPGPATTGRGNRYEIRLFETGISVSLGCSNVAVAGSVVDGVFRASDPTDGGIVTGSRTCEAPVERQWEPKLQRHLLAGEVRVVKRADTVTLVAPGLVVEGRAQ